ncbi:MAG: MerR family transcriptional regulator [Alistipes sp.]|nr:MerR family transcriptional regulator [Alistipes sp.]
MAEKLYYSMGEVAEMFDVNPSLIRYWGTRFAALRPKRNKKGNRMFTAEDIETLKLIHHLVKERGMTLDGARKALSAERTVSRAEGSAEIELLERLQAVRAMLVQVRDSYGVEQDEIVEEQADEEPIAIAPTAEAVAEKPAEEPAEEPAEVIATPEVVAEQPKEQPQEEQKEEQKPKKTAPKKQKTPKSDAPKAAKSAKATEKPAKKEPEAQSAEPSERPLPFYEQTLF